MNGSSGEQPNDSAFVQVIAGQLYGPMNYEAHRVLQQVHDKKITAKFGMIALARLGKQRSAARKARLHHEKQL